MCIPKQIEYQGLGNREVVGNFNGGSITSEAGGLLLREVDGKINLLKRFSDCFIDYRDPQKIEHSVVELVSQRVYGLTLGYEDLNDHDDLRRDRLLSVMVGKQDLEGNHRHKKSDEGISLAGKSTLNRLEQVYCARGDMENRIKEQHSICLPTVVLVRNSVPIS